MRKIPAILLLGIGFMVWADSACAKGAVDEIVIIGAASGRAIEVRDRQMLLGLDPWSGGFIDWKAGTITSPTASLTDRALSYEILFYMKWKGRHSSFDRGDLKLIYDVRYRPGNNGEPGYIYLPGKDDKYSVNMGTIIRENDDGKWHQASARLESLIKRALTH